MGLVLLSPMYGLWIMHSYMDFHDATDPFHSLKLLVKSNGVEKK